MKIIGLTGGIGTGKSTVSDYLKKHDIFVIDADKIAHDITKAGQPAVFKLRDAFGNDVLKSDNELDRKALAKIAFSSDENKSKLDEITHGAIKEEIARQLEEAKECGEKVAVLDVPLLIETKMNEICDVVWVVKAEYSTKIERIKARDNMNEDEIAARMNKQLPEDVLCGYADEIINNSGGKEELYRQLEHLIKKYA